MEAFMTTTTYSPLFSDDFDGGGLCLTQQELDILGITVNFTLNTNCSQGNSTTHGK